MLSAIGSHTVNNAGSELQRHGLRGRTDEEEHEELLCVDAHASAVGIVGRAIGRQSGRGGVVGRHEGGLERGLLVVGKAG